MLTNITVAVAFGNSASKNLDLALRERVSPNVDRQIVGHNGSEMLATGVYLADDSHSIRRAGRSSTHSRMLPQ